MQLPHYSSNSSWKCWIHILKQSVTSPSNQGMYITIGRTRPMPVPLPRSLEGAPASFGDLVCWGYHPAKNNRIEPFHSQEWSISNFPCILPMNTTPNSTKNLGFHSLLRKKLPHLYYFMEGPNYFPNIMLLLSQIVVTTFYNLPHPIAGHQRWCLAPTGHWSSTSDEAHLGQCFQVQSQKMAVNDILADWTKCHQGSATYSKPGNSHKSGTYCTYEIQQLFIVSGSVYKLSFFQISVEIHCIVDATWLIYVIVIHLSFLWILHQIQLCVDVAAFMPMAISKNCWIIIITPYRNYT